MHSDQSQDPSVLRQLVFAQYQASIQNGLPVDPIVQQCVLRYVQSDTSATSKPVLSDMGSTVSDAVRTVAQTLGNSRDVAAHATSAMQSTLPSLIGFTQQVGAGVSDLCVLLERVQMFAQTCSNVSEWFTSPQNPACNANTSDVCATTRQETKADASSTPQKNTVSPRWNADLYIRACEEKARPYQPHVGAHLDLLRLRARAFAQLLATMHTPVEVGYLCDIVGQFRDADVQFQQQLDMAERLAKQSKPVSLYMPYHQ